jgi:mono/diheme cytochrome c family protein
MLNKVGRIAALLSATLCPMKGCFSTILPCLIIAFFSVGLPLCVAADPIDFAADIQPILAERCASCHGGVKEKGGLNLLSRQAAMAKTKDGNHAIVPGDTKTSTMVYRVTTTDEDERMPPDGDPLTKAEGKLITRWIAEGAKWPTHWAFVAPDAKAKIPKTRSLRGWGLNDIDRFVIAKLRKDRVEPSPEADRITLIRRLSMDIIGLPPTPEEVSRFVEDRRKDAYERLVDRLLASPHYGERWGRHWLDRARYADSDGYEKDNNRDRAWIWRNWVIDAYNTDMPFDQFTIEQLAGDLLPGATPQQRLATAFHRQTLVNREGGVDAEEDRVKRLIDRVNTTAGVWLGLTIACTQCHNHPYDPLTQRGFYAFMAFFNNADEGEVAVPRGEGKSTAADVMVQRRKDPRTTYIFRRGDFLQPQKDLGGVTPDTPGVLPQLKPRDTTRVDRLDLANWLMAAENPLTGRVAANDVWTHLFGQSLATPKDDWGVRTDNPVHPDLLDWLAREYRRLGWSRKALIKTIVSSATYRQSSMHRSKMIAKDPANRLLHRQNRVRVEGEIIRDTFLAASGLLSSKINGPSVFPPIPEGVAAQAFTSNFKWTVSTGEDRYRRGMYTFFKRTAPDPNLMTFDCPDANVSMTTRGRSNTPLQALATLQNPVFHEAAQALAKRVVETAGDDRSRLTLAFQLCVARPPDKQELKRLIALLAENRAEFAAKKTSAAALATTHQPKGTAIEEAAAWVATTRIILNLDEVITRP